MQIEDENAATMRIAQHACAIVTSVNAALGNDPEETAFALVRFAQVLIGSDPIMRAGLGRLMMETACKLTNNEGDTIQ